MSWFVVFYEVMDRHLSSRSSLSAMDLRRKQALLYAVRQQELACWHVSGFSKFVYKSLSIHKSISALVCKHVDSNLHPNSSEEIHLTIYENCAYDSYDKPIGSLVNLAVGFSFIPLSLALVEDYGYSFFKLIGDENIFLILVFVCCVTLACLYLMSTYPIYHKMIDKLIQLVRDPREAIVSFIRRVPLYFMAGIAALNRMNASYSIFGSIAGRMDVPSGLGLTLVWFAVLVVATVDFCATLKIMSRSIKYIWMNSVRQMGDWRVGIPCLDAEIDRSVSRYYTKQLKILIRNSTEYELSCMVGYLL
ncbi:Hypothetical protein POVR2_LOCUS150 [uncultured virus]|nr:Hypothetical protein POVR2_LOCUS150 [uncultured virus]